MPKQLLGLTIAAVHWLNHHNTYAMGWFANGIIPVGAIFVGVASGLGYAIGSRLLHVKLGPWFLALMFITGVIDYFVVEYLTYTSIMNAIQVPGVQYSFLDYMRDQAEQMRFHDRHDARKEPGAPLGGWGYIVQLLILFGFALGNMIPSLCVFGMRYCHRCQTYLKKHRVGYFRSPESWSEIKRLKKADRKAALNAIAAATTTAARQIAEPLLQAPYAETDAAIDRLEPNPPKDAAATVSFSIMKCPHCDAHYLTVAMNTFTADKKPATGTLCEFDKTSVLRTAPVGDEPNERVGLTPLPTDDDAFFRKD